MRLFITGAALCVCTLSHADAFAQAGRTYPKVRGASGGLYGPTQAHYQYARRYGRAWRTDFPSNGSLLRRQGLQTVYPRHPAGYGLYSYPYRGYYGYGAVGYPNFGPHYTYLPTYPPVIQGQPIIIGPDPFDNDVLNRDQLIEDLQRLKNLIPALTKKKQSRLVKKSNGAARQRSLHQQGLGDFNFKERKFSKAYAHYRRAASAAPDLPDNYFRMAWALSAAGHHASAVREIKRGLRLDPYWPLTGESLDERFGHNNEIAKNNVLLSAAQWVREDIRDPDRLFLMGALLHFNNDIDKALKFFETAGHLAGSPQHVQLFLHPQQPPQKGDAAGGGNPDAAPQQPAGANPPPPLPEPEPVQKQPAQPAATGPVLPLLR